MNPQGATGVPGPGRSPHSDPLLVEIRPSSATYGRGVATRAIVLLPIIFIGLYNPNGSSLAPGVRWSIVGVGLVIAVVAIAVMVTRVQLTWTSIRIKRLIGSEKVIPRQQMSYGILVQQYVTYGNMTAPLLMLIGAGGHKFLHLSGQVFSAADLSSFAQHIGIQFFDVMPDPVTPKMIGERHPKVLSVFERRPFLIAWLLVLVVVVVVVVVAMARSQ